jgi:RimJ/RimL family protein N-acetyltransferase
MGHEPEEDLQPVRIEGRDVLLRPFDLDDLDVIERGLVGLGPDTLPGGSPSRERIREAIGGSGELIDGRVDLGIEAEGRLIGSIQTYVPTDRALPAGTFEFGIVIYRPEDRGRGFGTAAVTLLIDWLRSVGATRAQAVTTRENHAMRRCLVKLGFAPAEEVAVQGLSETVFVLDLVT